MKDQAGRLYLLRSFEALASGPQQSALRDELQAERTAATNRIDAYCRVLEDLSRRRSRATGSVDRALEEAAYLFNEGLFFEVHEILETVWLTQQDENRFLLQGLIQIAVGFHHLANRNPMGAISLLKEGVQKVQACDPDRSRVRLNQFLAQVECAHQSIASLGNAACDQFDRRMIPNMPLIRVHCLT